MWSQFAISTLIEAVCLLLPGYLIARALRRPYALSLCLAPAISAAIYEVWSLACHKLGIWADWTSIFLPVMAFSIALLAISKLLAKKNAGGSGESASKERQTKSDFIEIAAFVGASLLVATVFYVRCLDGAGSFFQAYDNLSHLLRVKTFVESGTFSPIGIDLSYDIQAGPYASHSSGFYPSFWHCIAALPVSLTGMPVTVACNVANFIFIGLVTPLSAWIFLSLTFKARFGSLLPCCILPLAFYAFPWGMVDYGPLYPNVAAYSMVLGVSASIMMCFMAKNAKERVTSSAIAFICVMGLGLTHPNAVFTACLLVGPFICVSAYRIARSRFPEPKKHWVAIAVSICTVAAALLLWALMLHTPIASGVVGYSWPSFTSGWSAIKNLLTLGLRDTPYQLLLSVLVLFGLIASLKDKDNRWLAVSWLIACVLFFVNAATDGALKNWLTGFWYNDSYRICGLVSLFFLPLASLGILTATEKAKTALNKLGVGIVRTRVAAIALCIAAALVIFRPNITLPMVGFCESAFGRVSYESTFYNDSSRNDDIYGADERAFVEKVKETIPEGSLVLNHPYDGSAFAYACSDLRTYWRLWGGFGGSSESEESKALRTSLCDIDSNDEIASIVRRTGAEYVLILDEGDLSSRDNIEYITSYHPQEWVGLESISESTPGFEVVLAQGDMKLYRIDK